MVDQVWISDVLRNGDLGNKLGLRHKWFGEPWQAPYERHYVPNVSERVGAALDKYASGETLKRDEMPEASAVYSMAHFRRAKDVLFIGAFLGVRGKVAEVLSRFDLGEGGGLIPYTIYEADEQTPLPEPYYLVNFGPRKDCLLPEASTNIEKLAVNRLTGKVLWALGYPKDGDIAVSPAALVGADLWMCPNMNYGIFMSHRLVEALRAALSDALFAEFRLSRCRVV